MSVCGDLASPLWASPLSSLPWAVVGSPCVLASTAAPYMLGVTGIGLYLASKDGAKRSGRRGAVTSALMAVCIAIMHLAGFAFRVAEDEPHVDPGALAMHAAGVIAWGVIAAALLVGASKGRAPRIMWVSFLMLPLYECTTYTYSILAWAEHQGEKPWHVGPLKELIVCAVFGLLQLVLACVLSCVQMFGKPDEDALTTPLLAEQDIEAPARSESRAKPKLNRSWLTYLGMSLKYVWPGSIFLQLRAVVCVLLVLSQRCLNLAAPIVYGHMVNRLADITQGTHPKGGEAPEVYTFWEVFEPWVALYLLVTWLQGGGGYTSGLVGNLRAYLWIPIAQDAYRKISLQVFKHVLDLDLNFHLHRRTGEMMRILDRGTNSMQNVLSTVMFNIVPQLFDIAAAASYMAFFLQPWVGVILAVTLGSYVPLTIMITEWRGGLRREMNARDNKKGARVTDALLNYETIKYFSNEGYEAGRYASAVTDYQSSEFRLLSSLNILNVLQSTVIFGGVACGVLLCVAELAQGDLRVGDVVLFIAMMAQLAVPLNFFGTQYRVIQTYMVDMEQMFDLLTTVPKVVDAPNAGELALTAGEITLDKVCFDYGETTVLKNVSFKVGAGETVAIVGPTGSGKSTLLRLLFRFYDTCSGEIAVDGTPIHTVTMASLRKYMGVVPQDSVLFNDTILHNIKYGRPECADEDAKEAAELSSIHDQIMSRFPAGYETIVGERGLRLSGGEKQRVAFARSILKNPEILLLDEATAALDSITEKKIQAALASKRAFRTTVIVAHRLSTIMDADRIVVMQHGEVVEMGKHEELLSKEGLYAEMWNRQQQMGSTADISVVSAPDGPGTPATPAE